MRTSLPLNNFSSGQVDRVLKGRIDIPLYQNGHEISENFCESIKGDAFYRPGFRFIDEIGDAALYEFKFNQEQSYLLVFKIEYIEFWTYNELGEFVRVLDDNGNELTLTHPWGTEVYNLCISQNCDVMYIQHLEGNYPEYQLKRKASNQFELVKTTYKNSSDKSLSSESATTDHGFPCTGSFYENRFDRCSSSKYYTYLYGSKGGSYDDITVGTGKNDGFQFDLAEANSKALWMISGANSLLIGTAEGILTVNGGSTTAAITPTDVTAKLSCRDGSANVRPVRKDNYVFYVSANGRKLFMFEYDVLLEQFKATNLSKANYEITKGGMSKIVYKNDQYDFMYIRCGGDILQVCFSNDEAVNAWAKLTTKGEVGDLVTVTRPDGDYDLFAKIKRKINGIDRFYLERLTDTVEFPRMEDYISDLDEDITPEDRLKIIQEDKYAFYRAVAETMRKCNHLDCSIEYSGLQENKITFEDGVITASKDIFTSKDIGRRIWYRSITGREYGIFDITGFIDAKNVKVDVLLQPSSNSAEEWYLSATVFSGLEHLEGEEVAVLGNGGYIGDFKVIDGKVDISSANTNKVGTAIIGLKYKGMLKSMNLGIQAQTGQTYTKNKNIISMILKLNFSAGGKVGTSLYNLEDVQAFDPDGLFDLPPLAMDTDKKILCEDKYEKEKHYYIVQDQPLPFRISMVVPEYKHVMN